MFPSVVAGVTPNLQGDTEGEVSGAAQTLCSVLGVRPPLVGGGRCPLPAWAGVSRVCWVKPPVRASRGHCHGTRHLPEHQEAAPH